MPIDSPDSVIIKQACALVGAALFTEYKAGLAATANEISEAKSKIGVPIVTEKFLSNFVQDNQKQTVNLLE